ncbi:hypothetical protein SNE40_015682 [Patella caerulea]|uniref:Galactosylceramide sulfotransferase-like n=1 Tax=Patella caerulea TaxID=87958 RepID=A0AAN8JLN5_PATCE
MNLLYNFPDTLPMAKKNHTELFVILLGSCCFFCLLLAYNDVQYSHTAIYKNTLQSMLQFNIKQKCEKKKYVAFLKVHKAGSSTVSNILQRFATRYGLNLVLPNKDRDSHPTMFHVIGRNYDRLIPIPDDEEFNILCNHVVYNRRQLKRWFKNGAFYTAIVRDPKERFLSSAFYFGLLHKITNGTKISRKGVFTNYLRQRIMNSSSADDLNMAHDFGVRFKYYHDEEYVSRYIQLLDIEFDLVMILEYFDESLILLKRKLCWDIRDIVYLVVNSNRKKDEHALSEEDLKILRDIQKPDEMLYSFFTDRFWKQVYNEGPDFFQEVQYFKSVQKRVREFCETGYIKSEFLKIEASRWNDKFHLLVRDCTWMKTNELNLNDIVMKRQWDKYNAFVQNRKANLINVV